MKRDILAYALALIPQSCAMFVLIAGWAAWTGEAPIEQHLAASRLIMEVVFDNFGNTVGAYFRTCPSLLTGTALGAQILAPYSASLFTGFAAAQTVRVRLRVLLLIAPAIMFVPHAMGALATLVLMPNLEAAGVVSWALSLWLRSSALLLPYIAVGLAVASAAKGGVGRVLCSFAAVTLWGLSSLASTAHPTEVLRSLVLNLSAEMTAVGALGCILLALLFVLIGPLTKSLLTISKASFRKGISMPPNKRLLAAVVLGVLLISPTARAYTKPGHFEITNAAYQIMRASAVSSARGAELTLKSPGECASGGGLCRATVTQAQWDDFLQDLDWTRRYLGSQPNGIPFTTGQQECTTSSDQTDVAAYVVTDTGPNGIRPASMASDHRHLNENKCSSNDWRPVDLYAEVTGRVPADGNGQQGKVLGWHAKNRDDDLQETMIDVNPIIGVPLGEALAKGGEAYEKLLGAIIVPFVCAFEWLNGDASSCKSDARRIADKTNLVEVFTAMIPGFRVDRSEDYIGFWHLMNIRDDSNLTNTFDDHQGMFLPEAGPQMIPGAMDSALRIGSQLLYVRIVPDRSAGTHRYSIRSGEDDDAPSAERTDLDWRREPFGTTEFSPLDNLALAGYERLHPNDPITRLGWPLHAIGDATIPMHVVATASWGHSSYEKWVEENWAKLTYNTECPARDSACRATNRANQAQQAKRVLQLAYRWREYLGHGPFLHDRTGTRPGVRDLIEDLGRDTLARVGDDIRAWPWCDLCSIAYDADFGSGIVETIVEAFPKPLISPGQNPRDALEDPVGHYDQYEGKIRELVESAMGAKIAFLNWHVQYQPNQCIADGHYGCVEDADCCDAQKCLSSNVCGVELL